MTASTMMKHALGISLALAGFQLSAVASAEPGDGLVSAAAAASASQAMVAGGMAGATEIAADARIRSAFNSWKAADQGAFTPASAGISIPSVHPVEQLSFTSNFGIRSDPFFHRARMHAGVDIRGPIGTAIYATADGTIDRAERAGGYGNMIEIDHGKGIQTRYGHLSRIIVTPGSRVTRGQLIGLMGSTGRSTGSHLHYEVRIDGHAVNPAPFLTTADFTQAARSATAAPIPVAMDGPAPQD